MDEKEFNKLNHRYKRRYTKIVGFNDINEEVIDYILCPPQPNDLWDLIHRLDPPYRVEVIDYILCLPQLNDLWDLIDILDPMCRITSFDPYKDK